MKSIRSIIIGLGLFALPIIIQAQLTVSSAETSTSDSIVQLTAEAYGLPPMAREDLPVVGTFWEALPNGILAPMPCPPLGESLPVYQMVNGSFLVDATGGKVSVKSDSLTSETLSAAVEAQGNAVADLIERTQGAELTSSLSMMSTMDTSSLVPEGGISYAPMALSSTMDYGTNLWIAYLGMTNGVLAGIGSNTLTDVQYEIQTKEDLAQADWQFEDFIYGSALTNWTPLSVAQNGRTNLFIRLRSWVSSDGSGLPDWWQQLYGVSDPYGDPDSDGWNNLQEFQNGTNPNSFNTPAAPSGMTVDYYPANNQANVQWLPGAGAITGYQVEKTYELNISDYNVVFLTADYNLTSTALSLNNDVSAETADADFVWYDHNVFFKIRAQYANGQYSDWSAKKPLKVSYLSASLVNGANSEAYLAVSGVPAGTRSIRLFYQDYDAIAYYAEPPINFSNDIPFLSFSNGLYALPDYLQPPAQDSYGPVIFGYNVFAQAIDENGNPLSDYCWFYEGNGWKQSFYDGREQLKQNLIFQLRAAPMDAPVSFAIPGTNNNIETLGAYVGDYAYSAGYAYAGLLQFANDSVAHFGQFDSHLPFEENYLFRNFAFSPNDADDDGFLITGIFGGTKSGYYSNYRGYVKLGRPLTYQVPTNQTNWPALLAANDTGWLYYDQPTEDATVYAAGLVTYQDNTNTVTISLASGLRNWFGLAYLSVKVAYHGYDQNHNDLGLQADLLPAGNSLTSWAFAHVSPHYYFETEQPQFQTVEYNFFNPNWGWDETLQDYVEPLLPGSQNFSPTNQSQPLFTTPGSSIQIAGYAKLEVVNSAYSGVYAYLGQYFDKAYKMDENGTVTTNTTGILSPYGDFFAAEPGEVALVTMEDLDTGERGTGIVHVVSLQVDKNHDGEMDLSFNGPDATSQASPMVFWVNNDSDYSDDVENDPGRDANRMKDCDDWGIGSQRDLEDLARLWICGMPALTNGNYQVTLSWGTVISGTPTINLFKAVETNGGTLYLTDTNVAKAQVYNYPLFNSPGSKMATISPSHSFTFPAGYFTNTGNKYWLFEGAGTNGTGELVLTVSDANSNTVAQASLWLDLHNVEDLYEEARATSVTAGLPPSSLISQYTILHAASALPDETKQVILHIHGMNVSDTQWKVEHTTIFKRLYWSGYRGRFASFKWPCAYLPFENSINPFNYNLSEFYAWKSATALKNYLCYLTNRADLAGYSLNILAHSQGNIVTGEAIKQGAPFDNYILTQAAAPAHCYDVTAPFLQNLLDADASTHTPFYPTNGGYHGYFTNLNAHGGRLINYFNTNDFALISGAYLGKQANWVADQETQKPEDFSWRFGQHYQYYSNGVSVAYYDFSQYTVTDLDEIRGLVARSRSAPVGGQGGLSGAIGSSVDLLAGFGFDKTRDEHSAQIARPLQTVWGYYDQVLRSFQLQPINRQ